MWCRAVGYGARFAGGGEIPLLNIGRGAVERKMSEAKYLS